jgi:hypothetical protein
MEEKKKPDIRDIDARPEEVAEAADPIPPEPQPKPEETAIANFLQNTMNVMVADYRIYPSTAKGKKVVVFLDALGRPLLNVSLSFDEKVAGIFSAALMK